MKKILLLALIQLSLINNSFGQNFYFPKYYKDSITLQRNMSALAKQVMAVYKEADKTIYFDNLFHFQIIAEQFSDANNSLDSIRNLLKASYPQSAEVLNYFYFQTYTTAKIKQTQSQVSFNDAYISASFPLFKALPEQGKAGALNLYNNSLQQERIKVMYYNFYKFLNDKRAKDSISFDNAKMLCRAYNSTQVYRQIVNLEELLIAEQCIIEDSILIKTRDGATITATVARRKDISGKQPTIFEFDIYINSRLRTDAVSNGYVSVVANTRGKRLSPQEIEPYEHDADDAYDIIDWISKQPWSNGKVGMIGGSYLGFSTWAAVKNIHPALKTIIPKASACPGVDGGAIMNNVFYCNGFNWLQSVTNSKVVTESEYWHSTHSKWYTSGKSFRSLDTIEGRPNKIFQRWLMHPSYDDYWQKMAPYKSDFSKINIPILTTTGYFDGDQLGAMHYFYQYHLYNTNPNHYLLIGPYDHGGAQGRPSSIVDGYKIDSVANISITVIAYQWFDYVLKESIKPEFLKDKINYQVMGTNEWKHVPSLSKMNNDTINFYLSNVTVAKNLSTLFGPKHYKLDIQPNAKSGFINQEIDFKVRSKKSNSFDFFWNSGKIIDCKVDGSNGILFISEPFDTAFEINGSFIGEIKASINKKDMDIAIKMYELMSDGKYFTLSDYLTRPSYAKDRSNRQLLTPEEIETVPINNSFFTSKKIGRGSRLLIVLRINKSPYWQINYGTGKDVSDEDINDAKTPLKIKWYNNSVIRVPVRK